MTITFNAFEILEMAEQIERNGIKFYRTAAKAISAPDAHQMLLDLAEMEVEHEKVFDEMKKELAEEDRQTRVFDPENETDLYLHAMANGHVFNLKKDPADLLTGKETLADIVKLAIGAEKDSIVFYLGLKDFVPVRAGKDKIDNIIKEEMSHITTLNRILSVSK